MISSTQASGNGGNDANEQKHIDQMKAEEGGKCPFRALGSLLLPASIFGQPSTPGPGPGPG
eukprot:CAMPEP_0113939350 /NCGR_PEP_ID=MMETSP1339-20121228/5690_1 /TAXON_ID=94617 /ORGANISM="Fibrocapsa japonica" /LENGTH=60 /DNA_ID=CAMNT_0000942837 /DNA_START=102 /DNA_END=281 /DNA_ORIENTATION=+ /assembly_acc=CAM_ASM_000762